MWRNKMTTLISFILLSGIAIFIFILSIQSIRIGKGIIQDPRYDTPAKRKYILIHGIVGTIISGICGLLFIYNRLL
jgi:hypothetical protein